MTNVTEPTTERHETPEPLPPVESLGFDAALAELQRVVAELETGGQPLERSLALYERGVALHERCATLLSDAELRLRQLVSRPGGGLEAVDVRAGEGEAN